MTSSDSTRKPAGRALRVVTALVLASSLSASFVAGSQPAFAAEPSAQDVSTARDLFKEGRKLEAAGDLKGALEKFKAAHALGRTPVTGIELAKTYAALNMPVEAREVCLGIERTDVAPEETQRSQDARKEASKLIVSLQKKIALLTLHIKGVPAGTDPIVKVDGAPLPAIALASARSLDPGDHTIVARVADGPETNASVTLKEGESKELDIVIALPPPKILPPPVPTTTSTNNVPPPPPPPQEGKRSVLVPIGVGVAVTGVVVGSITGIVALNKKSSLDTECNNGGCGPGQPQDDLSSARTFGTVSTVSFIVGGVGAGVAIVGLFMKKTPPSQSAKNGVSVEPMIGLGAFGLNGRF